MGEGTAKLNLLEQDWAAESWGFAVLNVVNSDNYNLTQRSLTHREKMTSLLPLH